MGISSGDKEFYVSGQNFTGEVLSVRNEHCHPDYPVYLETIEVSIRHLMGAGYVVWIQVGSSGRFKIADVVDLRKSSRVDMAIGAKRDPAGPIRVLCFSHCPSGPHASTRLGLRAKTIWPESHPRTYRELHTPTDLYRHPPSTPCFPLLASLLWPSYQQECDGLSGHIRYIYCDCESSPRRVTGNVSQVPPYRAFSSNLSLLSLMSFSRGECEEGFHRLI